MAPVGRPKMKNRLPNRPYNMSIETADSLNKLKKKGETQDGLVRRLLLEKEEITILRNELNDMTFLRDDAWKTSKDLIKSKAVLEIKLNEARQVRGIIPVTTLGEYMILPWIF